MTSLALFTLHFLTRPLLSPPPPPRTLIILVFLGLCTTSDSLGVYYGRIYYFSASLNYSALFSRFPTSFIVFSPCWIFTRGVEKRDEVGGGKKVYLPQNYIRECWFVGDNCVNISTSFGELSCSEPQPVFKPIY